MQSLVRGPGWADSFLPAKVFAARIDDAFVLGSRFSIIHHNGELVSESLYMWPQKQAAELILGAGEPDVSDAPLAYMAGNAGYRNYYHWTLQCLAGLALIPLLRLPGEFRLITPPLNRWQKRSLELAGFSKSHWEPLAPGQLRKFSKLIYPSLLSGASAVRPWPGIRPFFSAIRDQVTSGKPGDGLIYISRKDSIRRRLLNEDDLCAALQGVGFTIVTLTGMSLDEQIETFATARLIVAQHGGGLANLVYCRPGTTVLELNPSHYINNCFFRLAQLFDLSYWGDAFHVEAGDRYRHRVGWTVDIPYVLERIRNILSR
jgi:capsular polysaccharide biosynthesis protein